MSTTTETHFNPHSHEGSDKIPWNYDPDAYSISIHAPTRGATGEFWIAPLYFILFQSTPPRGERLYYLPEHCKYPHFNPRPHEGSDPGCLCECRNLCISIHAPTRGATLTIVLFSQSTLFQSTPPRGERHSRFRWGD